MPTDDSAARPVPLHCGSLDDEHKPHRWTWALYLRQCPGGRLRRGK